LYYLNPNDFTVPSAWNSASYIPTPAQRTYGMPRNSIPGIGVMNLDLAVTKKTSVFRERASLELRFEMFDALNHTEFGSTTPGQSASGVNVSRTSTLFGQVTSVLGNRVGQVAARLQF
jgi:hypothetical protein